jgi:hypothetical protein
MLVTRILELLRLLEYSRHSPTKLIRRERSISNPLSAVAQRLQQRDLPRRRWPGPFFPSHGRHNCKGRIRKQLKSKSFVAAGPVSRILSAGLLQQDGHSSRPRIAAGLKRPTRRFDAPSRHVPGLTRKFLPIWSCSVWGLPCPPHYCDSGALLPHLFTLTLASPSRRYIFCGTFRQPGLNPASRTLSGTLLCGVRTFLSRSLTKQERPSGPAAN